MTREELIARIEAGETGPELLCAIADEIGWDPPREQERGDPPPATVTFLWSHKIVHVPDWLHSLDAAVALVGDIHWCVDSEGDVHVWGKPEDEVSIASVPNNPAAALVAAWLKATA